MLVQFSFKNFLSFKDETVLDLSAINAYKEHEYNLLLVEETKERFIKVAAVYGANASGKSNLVYAYACFRNIIRESFNNVEDNKKRAISEWYTPFLFDGEKNNSEFEVIEIIGGYEYRYGFEYNEEKVCNEWMYRKNLKTNRTSIIFERDENCNIQFGASVRDECKTFSEQIPQETLVLSFFNRLRMKTVIFNDVYESIMDTLAADTDFCEEAGVFGKLLLDLIDEDKDKLLYFLNAIDTGIKDIRYRKEKDGISFFTIHLDSNGEQYELPLFHESEGTIKCIALYMYVDIAVTYGRSLLIDELNVKLHPLLLKFIINLFYEKDSKGQLIYTTHDTTLLDRRFFRRDQIWFVQKDEFGHSKLYALSDFKVRPDASFEKDYLGGVYGGIPVLKEFEIKGEQRDGQ